MLLLYSRAFISVSNLYYLIFLVVPFTLTIYYKQFNFNSPLKWILLSILLFSAWCFLSTLWSQIPLITFLRSSFFLFISLSFLIFGYLSYSEFRNLSIIYFLALLLIAINLLSLIFHYPPNSWSGGNSKGFMGISTHQNTLGALIFFSMMGIYDKFYELKKSPTKLLIMKFIGLLFVLFFLLSLTHSRISILVSILLFFVFIFLQIIKARSKKSLLLVTSIVVAIFILVFLDSFKDLVYKHSDNFLSTRVGLLTDSYYASLESPVIGIGYGVSSSKVKGIGNFFDLGNIKYFIREKGSGVLALIEEVGVIGLILFLVPFVMIIRYSFSFKDKFDDMTILLLIFLIGCFIHAQFEAWWVGPGSVFLPLYFFYNGFILSKIKT